MKVLKRSEYADTSDFYSTLQLKSEMKVSICLKRKEILKRNHPAFIAYLVKN